MTRLSRIALVSALLLALAGCAAQQAEPVMAEPEALAELDTCPTEHDDGIGGTGCQPEGNMVARDATHPWPGF